MVALPTLAALMRANPRARKAWQNFVPPAGYPPIHELLVAQADDPAQVEALFYHYLALVREFTEEVSVFTQTPVEELAFNCGIFFRSFGKKISFGGMGRPPPLHGKFHQIYLFVYLTLPL